MLAHELEELLFCKVRVVLSDEIDIDGEDGGQAGHGGGGCRRSLLVGGNEIGRKLDGGWSERSRRGTWLCPFCVCGNGLFRVVV